jgi:membrane-associated phospholipid phosphatase
MDRAIPLPQLRPSWTIAAATVAAILFIALALDLRLHGPVTRADVPVSHWFALHALPSATRLALAISALHSTLALTVFAAAAAGVLALQRQSQWVPLLVATVPGGLVLNGLVKLAFHRPRPVVEHPLVTLSTFSFPSGHAVGATVCWGFALVLWFAVEGRVARRAAGCVVAFTLVLLTALSRVYLGAHYPADVLAGIAEGTLWVLLCCWVVGVLDRRRRRVRGAAA